MNRKGQISAAMVFVVVSVIMSGVSIGLSTQSILGAFQGLSESSDHEWMEQNIGIATKTMCEETNRVMPIASNYSRSIPDLDRIELDFSSFLTQDKAEMHLKYVEDSPRDDHSFTIEDKKLWGSITCDDEANFNGSVGGNTVSGQTVDLNPENSRILLRVFAGDDDDSATIQVYQGEQ